MGGHERRRRPRVLVRAPSRQCWGGSPPSNEAHAVTPATLTLRIEKGRFRSGPFGLGGNLRLEGTILSVDGAAPVDLRTRGVELVFFTSFGAGRGHQHSGELTRLAREARLPAWRGASSRLDFDPVTGAFDLRTQGHAPSVPRRTDAIQVTAERDAGTTATLWRRSAGARCARRSEKTSRGAVSASIVASTDSPTLRGLDGTPVAAEEPRDQRRQARKIFTKLIREIAVAAGKGVPDPTMNARLAVPSRRRASSRSPTTRSSARSRRRPDCSAQDRPRTRHVRGLSRRTRCP